MDLPGDRKLPDPVDVGRAQFETAKKGYDQGEVRSYLAEVAKGLGDYRELVKELERRIESLEAQLADAAAESDREITEAELTERLGTEAARVLNAAREGAEERRRSVEAELESERVAADDLVAAARDEAAAVIETARAEADRAAADRLAETEAELAERTLAVDVELAERRAEAEAEVAALVAEGEADRDEGRSAGRSMVAEAQVVRERILGDLAKRRQSGRRELEQIRAGRDRLLGAFNVANEELAGLLEELKLSLPEARAAAQRAGHSVDLEEVTAAQIEHELEAARLVGHPLVDLSGVDDHLGSTRSVPAEAAVDAGATDASDQPDVVGTDDAVTSASVPALEDDAQNVVLAELGARRSRLTKAGRIAQQLPTGEIPVLKAAPVFEGVRLLETDGAPDAGSSDPASGAPTSADGSAAVAEASADEVAAVQGAVADEPAPDESLDEVAAVEEPEIEAEEPAVEGSPDEVAGVEMAMSEKSVAQELPDGVAGAEGDVVAELPDAVAGDEVAASEQDMAEEDMAEEDTAQEPPEEMAGAEGDVVEEPPAQESAPEHQPLVIQLSSVETEAQEGPEAEEGPDDDAVEALFAKVRAAQHEPDPDRSPDVAGTAVATLTRADEGERVSVIRGDPIAARDRITRELEQSVARALKRALADDQNELLDAARQKRTPREPDDLVSAEDHLARYVDRVQADLVEAFHAGATAGGDPSVDTELAEAIEAVDAELVRRLRDDLAELLVGDAEQLADGLRHAARRVRGSRLEEAASFAVLTAYGTGLDRALANRARRWVRDERHECGPDCEANARAGAVDASGGFSGPLGRPPMFPGCRCTLVRA